MRLGVLPALSAGGFDTALRFAAYMKGSTPKIVKM